MGSQKARDMAYTVFLRETNASKAVTRECPTEILSSIFVEAVLLTHSTEGSSRRLCPWVLDLAGVCYRWREIALGTPALWSQVTLTLPPPGSAGLHLRASFLQACLERSGNRPLYLNMTLLTNAQTYDAYDFDDDAQPPMPLIHSVVDNLLIGNFHRIWDLDLTLPSPMFFEPWNTHTRRLSSLRSFTLNFTQDDNASCGELDLMECPSLARLRLRNVPSSIFVQPDVIHSLELELMPLDVCIELLFHCTNVVQYKMKTPRDVLDDFFVDRFTQAKTFPTLQLLAWEYQQDDRENALLRYLRAPNLRELRWDQAGIDEYMDGEAFEAFGNLLPPGLEVLEIHNASENANLLFYLSHYLELPNGLHLACNSWQELADSVSFLTTVTDDPTGTTGAFGPFPRLDRLTISGIAGQFDVLRPKQVLSLLKKLSLRVQPGKKIVVDFHNFDIDWDAVLKLTRTLQDIAKLISTGALHVLAAETDPFTQTMTGL